jgi:hypothetical protein
MMMRLGKPNSDCFPYVSIPGVVVLEIVLLDIAARSAPSPLPLLPFLAMHQVHDRSSVQRRSSAVHLEGL